MRFAAPLQSWDAESKFERRGAGRSPTKSGVIGLCAAALGFRRHQDENLAKLQNLFFGVRIDKPGVLLKDFHMAHEEGFWDPINRSKINRGKSSSTYLTTRYYLADAVFLVGLEGDEDFLLEIDEALRYPMFPLFLGRRSCPPEGQLCLGIVTGALQKVLEEYPPIVSNRHFSSAVEKLHIVIDTDCVIGEDNKKARYELRDIPQSFNPIHRKYNNRSVCEFDVKASRNNEDHDALSVLEEM